MREDVDAHRGEVALGLLGLLLPLGDPVLLVEGQDRPSAIASASGHAADRDRHVRAVAPVGRDERLVVHLVDVVAGQDQDRVAGAVLDDVEVLEHRVGRAAVPLGHAAAGDVRLEQLDAAACCGPGPTGRPRPMWSLSERGLYWVRTTTSSMPELTQFDSVKSMIRYLPPNGTAGLARTEDRIDRRSPSPPARMTAIVRFTGRHASERGRSGRDASTGGLPVRVNGVPRRARPATGTGAG